MSGISWWSQIQSPLKEQLKNNNKTVIKNKRPHVNILYTLAIKGCDLLHSVLVLGIWNIFRSFDYAIQLYILFLECPVFPITSIRFHNVLNVKSVFECQSSSGYHGKNNVQKDNAMQY
jgi:hypothetical protein